MSQRPDDVSLRPVQLGSASLSRLVPLACRLAETVGGWSEAASLVLGMPSFGLDKLQSISSDVKLLIADDARALGLVDQDGVCDPIVAAEMLVVMDVLARAQVPISHPAESEPAELVFTVPAAAAGLVAAHRRLDLVVRDALSTACDELLVGGPFWNQEGVDLLSPLLQAAISARCVAVKVYAHKFSEPDEDSSLAQPLKILVEELRTTVRSTGRGSVRLMWFRGDMRSLMHAKFVVADRRGGYLGTANLTSKGLGEHLEVGVSLVESQAIQLSTLLEALEAIGVFVEDT